MHYYDLLLEINYSLGVALNRVYALYKAWGKEIAVVEAGKLYLANNYFYFALLGELYQENDDEKASVNFCEAFSLAKTENEKQLIKPKMKNLK